MAGSLQTIGIVGVGHVGAHCAFALAMSGLAEELVLVDPAKEKLAAEVQDLGDAAAQYPRRVQIRAGECEDLAGCGIVVISVGGMALSSDRLEELYISAAIVDEIVPRIVGAGFDGIFLSITNPCDIIAHRVWQRSGFDSARVIGTGTGLDSLRFRAVLGRETGVNPRSIEAYMLGEHGESQTAFWSGVRVGGKPLGQAIKGPWDDARRAALAAEVRRAGWIAMSGKHATEYAIACALADLAQCVAGDEKRVLAASTLLTGQYGQDGIYAGLPCVIGRNGVERVLAPDLIAREEKAFLRSCGVIRENIARLDAVR